MTRPPIVIHRPIITPQRPEKSPTERPSYTPPPKPSPLALAQHWLGKRFEERPLSLYLDGQPAKLDRVMQETNRLLKAQGLAQVDANPAWVVHD